MRLLATVGCETELKLQTGQGHRKPDAEAANSLIISQSRLRTCEQTFYSIYWRDEYINSVLIRDLHCYVIANWKNIHPGHLL